MEKRTKEFLQVSFYLSKFGVVTNDTKYPLPPYRLKTEKWHNAYRMFYDKLNGERTILAFERSLKNARDAYDSHFPDSGRIGWKAKDGKPNQLSKAAQNVFDELKNKSEKDVWNIIKKLSDLKIIDYGKIIDDLIGVQESEIEYKIGKTEGGKKVFTSSRYERNISNRNQAINIHSLKCQACGFDFQEFYGKWGEGFIEVHHIQALANNEGKEVKTNPEKGLAVLCANCHRMIHRKKSTTLTIEELKTKIKQALINKT